VALLSTTGENQALDALSGGATNLMAFVALHTATTLTTGASENAATGGYARQAETWNAASAGAKTNSGALTFSTLGSVPVTHLGMWSAVTAGTFGIGAPLGASVTAASITVAAGAISLTAT
jgi:hypothetical protein